MNKPQIPDGCKAIYHVKVTCEIKRFRRKKFYKEKFTDSDLYKEGDHKDENSRFYRRLLKKAKLRDNEEFKITDIDKIKYISYSEPQLINK